MHKKIQKQKEYIPYYDFDKVIGKALKEAKIPENMAVLEKIKGKHYLRRIIVGSLHDGGFKLVVSKRELANGYMMFSQFLKAKYEKIKKK